VRSTSTNLRSYGRTRARRYKKPQCYNESSSASSGNNDAQKESFERAQLERSFAAAAVAEPVVTSSVSQTAMCTSWPSVDWSRFNLQLLFVDRTDTVRARVAAGLFERIAEWNGWSRAMLPWTCGLHVQQAGPEGEEETEGPGGGLSKVAALMSSASQLGLPPRQLARRAEQFDLDDLDRYDLVLVLDHEIRDEILSKVPGEYLEYYEEKICLLTSFSHYESEATMLARGGLALLPMQLSWLLRQGLEASRKVVDIPSPNFSSETAPEEWLSMVRVMILSCGGLCKYLMDAFPENMPHYDPVD